ncbi:GAF domain-containing protein [Methylobacterium sp. J-059]|uniref:sensor histidine kinase n=1 Tax=Methylobacterium sp. J-059 TaxID=2836643 RepID=UPI001FBBCED4|nr:GAF domain-containing protein [Methylobacterium sp. J-059]MCJ2042341.1 GAF domain-containing protein [Methylobacterium sp. J-059]
MDLQPGAGMSPETSDPDRLAELEAFAVLDTAPEEAFDDAVQIARTICLAPVALVSLVAADRQWFKARVGFPRCETDLNASVCKYALGEPDLLVIPDLTLDSRTRDNPLVTGDPRIRFYAGAPLRTTSGRALGSLCVIDNVPRPDGLTEEQADALRRLARQIMILMRERRQLVRLRAEERLTRAASIRRAALIELGDHLRDVASVAAMTAKAAAIVGRTLDASRAGYGEIDASGAQVTVLEDWTASGAGSLAGTHRFADFGRLGASIERGDALVVRAVADDPRTAAFATPFAALAIGAMLDVPVRERGRTVGLFFVHAAAPRDWLPEEIAFARNVADRVQVGIGRLRAEEQQAVLNRELSHRMKNTLAMVQAIAMQTMRNATDLEAARDALANRLIALGKAHDILLDGTRESASLEKVVHGALTIHDDAQAGRLRLFGPHVQVGSKAALSLSLMIHELATNAAKYGALSTPAGFVVVDWSIDPEGREPMVRLRWAESGGPRVAHPTRMGFGSRLIERGLAGAIGGEVRLTYPPDGVLCELAVPLAGMEADE